MQLVVGATHNYKNCIGECVNQKFKTKLFPLIIGEKLKIVFDQGLKDWNPKAYVYKGFKKIKTFIEEEELNLPSEKALLKCWRSDREDRLMVEYWQEYEDGHVEHWKGYIGLHVEESELLRQYKDSLGIV